MHRILCCLGLAALGPAPGVLPVATAWTPPRVVQDDAAQGEFEALVEELDKARESFYQRFDEWQAAQKFDDAKASAEEREAYQRRQSQWWSENDPSAGFLPRFEALAARQKGTPAALSCYIQIIELDSSAPGGSPRACERALAALLSDHLAAEELEAFCLGLQYGGPLSHVSVVDALGKIRGGSPHRKVKAAATFALAVELGSGRADAAKRDENRKTARGLYDELAKTFGDLNMPAGKSYARVASAFVFELDHLGVGSPAPDFEALDETGARFKLSDYRGKVVMLDFWGFW